MKLYTFMFLSLILMGCQNSQVNSEKEEPIKVYSESEIILDSIISLAKIHSLYSQNVDWNILKKEMFEKLHLESKDSISALVTSVRYMLKQLGDSHGSLTYKGQQYGDPSSISREHKGIKYVIDSKTWNEILNSKKEVETAILEDNIAYIRIPTIHIPFTDEAMQLNTANIREQICALKQEKPKAWILDLRTNLGGNMYVMLSGLGELLPPNYTMGGDTKNGSIDSKWQLKEGIFYYGDIPTASGNLAALNCNTNQNSPQIAVLSGRYTASSGEAVAAALIGQKGVKVFGEQSEGKSNSTSWYPLPDNTWLSLGTSYYMSENGTVHTDGIIPDQFIIEDLSLDHLTVGKTIEEALKWLNASTE